MKDLMEKLRERADLIRKMQPTMADTAKMLDGSADEIKKLQLLVGSMLKAQHRQERKNFIQEEALRKLRNEACAILGFENAFIAIMGNSNIAVLKMRVEEADRVLGETK